MTAPFAPPPSRAVVSVVVALAAVAIVVPFARREDWLGWTAFAVLVAANIVLWGLLFCGVGRAARDWWYRRRE